MEFAAQLRGYQERVEAGLNRLLPAPGTRPSRLHEAMRYAALGGGKRIRPILTLAAAERCGTESGSRRREPVDPLPAAVAIECIHTYSLVHDDLPAMDNDDLRRGRPTAHRQFDEATALLAGDALLTFGFQLIGRHYAHAPAAAAALTREIADAAGSEHLIGGQMEDLLAEKRTDLGPGDLEYIHLNKTAALLTASLVAGGICGGGSDAELLALRTVGRNLGLAFQIMDDVLDATADSETLGKTAGKDARADKMTYVKLHGIDASRRLALEHSQAAIDALARLADDDGFLTTLVESLAERRA
jgi:geranylgeranyl diphosphate synthase type II